MYQNLLLFNSFQSPERATYRPRAVANYEYSIAYRYGKKERSFRQVELKAWIAAPKNERYHHSQKEVVIRYDWGRTLQKKLFDAVEVTPGVGLSMGYLHETVAPQNSFEDNLLFRGYAFGIAGVLHLSYAVTDQIGIEIGFNVIPAVWRTEVEAVEDSRAETTMETVYGEFNMMADRLLRLGISYRL